MKVIMEPEFAKREDLAKMVRAAVPLVEALLEKSASRITVNFALASDEHGKPLVRLAVCDDLTGTAQFCSEFPIEELRSPEAVREKIYRTWRLLMDQESEKSLEYLKANVPTE